MDAATSAAVQAGTLDLAFKILGAVGATLVAVGGAIGFFLKLYWDTRVRQAEAKIVDRLKQREILYQSLKWFEGGTQNRSIGISVVNSSWSLFPELQSLWIEVLANQATYLLTGSKQGEKAHEHENLRRILAILDREYASVLPETKSALGEVIDRKLDGSIKTGLVLTPRLEDRLLEWQRSKLMRT